MGIGSQLAARDANATCPNRGTSKRREKIITPPSFRGRFFQSGLAKSLSRGRQKTIIELAELDPLAEREEELDMTHVLKSQGSVKTARERRAIGLPRVGAFQLIAQKDYNAGIATREASKHYGSHRFNAGKVGV